MHASWQRHVIQIISIEIVEKDKEIETSHSYEYDIFRSPRILFCSFGYEESDCSKMFRKEMNISKWLEVMFGWISSYIFEQMHKNKGRISYLNRFSSNRLLAATDIIQRRMFTWNIVFCMFASPFS